MICYKCGANAGREEICPDCGASLEVFQRMVRISNAYYNDGLTKAQVHNLSGAILSLQKSLKFNKYNIEARNLLGLVYHELGEFVDAICEWVISTNFGDEENPAIGYLQEMHQKGVIERVDQTVRKFNQAIQYCEQGDKDMAEIQLKKVISMSPRFVRAHQMLALLYMEKGQPDKAKKALRAAGKVDTDNTLTLRYLMECNRMIREKGGTKKQKDDDLLMYQSGNETIIMPKRFRESSLSSYLMYMGAGLLLGILMTAFLIVPQVKKQYLSTGQEQAVAAGDTISSNNQTISELEAKVAELQSQLSTANRDGASIDEITDQYQKLLDIYPIYIKGDSVEAAHELIAVDTSLLGKGALDVYNTMWNSVKEKYLEELFKEANSYFKSEAYDSAMQLYLQIVNVEKDYEVGSAAYHLAICYEKSGDSEDAQEYFRYVIKKHPDSDYAKNALDYMNGISQ